MLNSAQNTTLYFLLFQILLDRHLGRAIEREAQEVRGGELDSETKHFDFVCHR